MEDIFDRLQAIVGISKYSNSEVITPKNIVKDMVDLLPADVFVPEARFLDPAVKSGRFLAEIYRRLMDSPLLSHMDEQSRRRHILEHQLYGLATSATAATIVRKQLYDDPTIAGNIVYTDGYPNSIKSKDFGAMIQGAFNIMKFNVVIGNPPYNKDIFLDFVSMGYDLSSQYTCMITPAKWQTDADDARTKSEITYKQFRDKIAKHISHVVFYPQSMDIFDIYQIDGITYTLIDKFTHTEAKVVNKCSLQPLFNSEEVRSISNRETLHNIGNDVINHISPYKHFTFNHSLNGRYQVWTNSQVSGSGSRFMSNDGKAMVVGVNRVIDSTDAVEMSFRSGASTCSFSSDSKQECEYFVSWLNTKFTRFFVAINISKLTVGVKLL